MSIFEKFNKNVDLKGLKADLDDVQKNGGGGGFEKTPHGKYEVKVEKMELKTTKSGDKPMLSMLFKILDGPHKNKLIFYNQVVTSGYGLHNANEMLKSLKSGEEIVFEDYVSYAALVENVFKAVDGNLEYELDYRAQEKNDKFDEFEIINVFED